MNKLDKFILKAFIGPFVAILLVVIFVLVMQFLWVYIDELVGKGLSIKVVLEFLMWGGCTILPQALPLATLLSSMMTIGQMGENSELIAIKAAGISLTRVMAPLFAASALISVGAFFVGNDLVPKACNEIFTLRDDLSRTKNEIKIPRGTFYDGIDGYILRIEDRNDDNGMMYGVMVYDHTGKKGNTSVTLADSSIMKMSKKKDYLTFTLFNGASYQESNGAAFRDSSFELQRIDFLRQDLVIPLQNYSFEKSDSSRFGDQAKSMRMNQLKHSGDSLRRLTLKEREKHYAALVQDNPFTYRQELDTSARRGNSTVFEDESFRVWRNKDDLIDACNRAASQAEMLAAKLDGFQRDVFEYGYYLRRIDIEWYKKLAQALACLILFFIGAPLGALLKKGGLGTSAIISVLFFVLYWVIDISGNKLARDGAVHAYIGTFIASAVLLPIGIYLSWKAINDSSFSSMDTIKTLWKKARGRIRNLFHKTRIVYMGTPEFAVAPLDALIETRHKVVGVVTVADKPSGRGLKMNESAVKQYAVEHGIPVLQPVKLKDPEFLAQLAAFKADMFVVVAFRMLPEEVWSMPKLGTFNLHASLLPQYRGAAPINWAVINGERITGVTTFMIDKEIDTGQIIFRQEYRIRPDETAGELHDALMGIGAKLVVDTVDALVEKNADTRVQRSFIQGMEVLKPAPKLTRELCHIDWNKPTKTVYNLIRGLSPYPAAFTELVRNDERIQLKVFSTEEFIPQAALEPGEVFSDGKTVLVIGTADGALAIKELQIGGKKRMDVKAFLLGFRDPMSWKAE